MYSFNEVLEASLISWLLLVSDSTKITVYFALNLNNLFTSLVSSLVSQFSLLSPSVKLLSLFESTPVETAAGYIAIAVYWEAIRFLDDNPNYIDKLSSFYSLDWTTGLQCFIVHYVITVYVIMLHKCINESYNRCNQICCTL